MLKIGLVVGPRREQHDAFGPAVEFGAGAGHGVDQGFVGRGQTAHPQRLEGLRKLQRDAVAVFQQIAQARGGLRALRDHPPLALRAARQIEGGNAQVRLADRRDPLQGAQVAGMAMHQLLRQQGFGNELLRSVYIGHDGLEHLHPLAHARLDRRPVVGADQHGQQVQRPGTLRAVGIGVDVVGHAVVADQPLERLLALIELGRTGRLQRLQKVAPGAQGGRIGRCAATAQLVIVPGQGPSAGGQRGRAGLGEGVALIHGKTVCPSCRPGLGRCVHQGLGVPACLKSSVNGNSGLAPSGGTCSGPGL